MSTRAPELKRICLGTVYQGTDYGYGGDSKPSGQDSVSLLGSASDRGVEVFDTAAEYGEAERLLGEVFGRGKERRGRARVVSKLPHGAARGASKRDYLNLFKNCLDKTLSRLDVPGIDAYLFHSAGSIHDKCAVEAMQEIKSSGLADNIGVSVYDPADALAAAGMRELDYIQVPYNVFDTRLDRTEFFDIAAANGKTVFARSIFLQGMLLETPDSAPAWLPEARPYIARFREIIGEMDPARACVQYCRANEGIDHIIMGVRDEKDLAEDVGHFLSDVERDMVEKLKRSFDAVDEKVIDPRTWRKG
jgi:aryl-alcohol dehydrogenase-like predicted oxidoreductase